MQISDKVGKTILKYLEMYLIEEHSDYCDSYAYRELDSLISILENKLDPTVENS